ncbi:MAG TPA: transposase [Candidatus Paceibacterota bacterium]|nr:transposase [Candidatus Paceibacterota bacterium]
MNRGHFAVGEWYHCYSRGIEKRKTFVSKRDYERFIQLLYLCNSPRPIHRSNLRNPSLGEVLNIPRQETLVSLGAFCLMPNHFHLLVKEKREQGISRFMQKLGTAYTMYFNIKETRVGGLFTKPFRSRLVGDDRYFQYALQYIHCNPAELYEAGWKEGVVKNMKELEQLLVEYPYGSFGVYQSANHRLRPLLADEVFEIQSQATPARMLREARLYYAERVKASP